MKKLACCGNKNIWMTLSPDEQQFYYEENGHFRRIEQKIAWEYVVMWRNLNNGKRIENKLEEIMKPEEAKKRVEFAANLGWRIQEAQRELESMQKRLKELYADINVISSSLEEVKDLLGRGDF